MIVYYCCPRCHYEWEEDNAPEYGACDSTCPECDLGDITALDWEDEDAN